MSGKLLLMLNDLAITRQELNIVRDQPLAALAQGGEEVEEVEEENEEELELMEVVEDEDGDSSISSEHRDD